MTNKFFKGADFSDIEKEINKVQVVASTDTGVVTIPETDLLKIKKEIEHEFSSCEEGTSAISKRPAIHVPMGKVTPARNMLGIALREKNAKSLNKLIHCTKEDYGYLVASWLCEKLSVIYPKATHILNDVMKGTVNVND